MPIDSSNSKCLRFHIFVRFGAFRFGITSALIRNAMD
ncbi:unnamed protein product [Brassica napus]|uniref:(rape) hypothetical protein n=1 Tax=Brassica napus TaxID=3708 RepID=A0A817AUV8_BRANA|nr:unnamed protein product [Brassica napus]